MSKSQFSQAALRWHARHGRHDLPWQQSSDPYPIWVAEIMLQQTQVSTALPYFKRFIGTFESVESLAAAELDEVLHLWSGLGYYARARNLHRSARIIVHERDGAFPTTPEELVQLPGIGRSSAGAIAAAAFGKRAAILDGNVRRILCRVHGIAIAEAGAEARLWHLAEELTPSKHVRDYNQAMMDLGATLCRRSKPHCEACPLRRRCHAFQMQAWKLYPGVKARKKRPLHRAKLLLIQDPDGEILLARRAENGLWGGLWALPEASELPDWLRNALEKSGFSECAEPSFDHDFSHFRLRISPIRFKLKRKMQVVFEADNFIWYDPAKPARIGIPAPIANLVGSPLEQEESSGV